jgi:hypothetical protein
MIQLYTAHVVGRGDWHIVDGCNNIWSALCKDFFVKLIPLSMNFPIRGNIGGVSFVIETAIPNGGIACVACINALLSFCQSSSEPVETTPSTPET